MKDHCATGFSPRNGEFAEAGPVAAAPTPPPLGQHIEAALLRYHRLSIWRNMSGSFTAEMALEYSNIFSGTMPSAAEAVAQLDSVLGALNQ